MWHLTDDEATAIRDALLTWQSDGVKHPTIPAYRDVDGDGIPDVFGLGPDDELVLVPDATVEGTVSRANGSGIETGGTD